MSDFGVLGEWPGVLAPKWYVCEEPERRLNLDSVFHLECHGCRVAIDAAIARSGSVADEVVFGHLPTAKDRASMAKFLDAANVQVRA